MNESQNKLKLLKQTIAKQDFLTGATVALLGLIVAVPFIFNLSGKIIWTEISLAVIAIFVLFGWQRRQIKNIIEKTFFDIQTEHLQEADRLETLLLRQYVALKAGNMGIWEFNISDKSVYWDGAMFKIYGVDPLTEIPSADLWTQLIHPDDLLKIREATNKAIESGESVEVDYRIVRSDGEIRLLRSAAVVVRDRFHKAIRLVGINQDISERARLESQLSQARKFTEVILDALPDPVFVKDIEHRWVYGNNEFSKLLGMSKDVFIGKSDYDLFPQDMADHFWQKDREVFDSQNSIEVEEKVIHAERGVREISTKKTPVLMADGRQALVGVIRDVTETKKEHLKLLEQTKMASLGLMASGLAHEINNPLTIILGKIDRLKKRVHQISDTSEELESDFDKIERNAFRISRIIKAFKSFSRSSEQDPFIRTSMSSVIDEALELCRDRFKSKGIDLRVKAISTDQIDCRPGQICQVLVNLLNNAFDAVESMDNPWVEIQTRITEDGLATITITDSGRGIEQSIVPRLMEPFFTTKEIGKGTGLGLSISKGIIEAHGGKLFYNHQSENTQFMVVLPLTRKLDSVEDKINSTIR